MGMNKKGQYYGPPEPMPYDGVSPIFIIGIIIMCAPLITPVFGFKTPGFIGVIGVVITLIGGAITIYNKSNPY